jgi:hypothetical protein
MSIEDTNDHFWGQIMHLVFSRICPFIDSQTLEAKNGREALFRQNGGGFILYLSDSEEMHNAEERVVHLDARGALIWINEPPESQGSFWQ